MLPHMHAEFLYMGQILICAVQLLLLYPASVFIKMKKPIAAIRDANAALEVMHLSILYFVFLKQNVDVALAARFKDVRGQN